MLAEQMRVRVNARAGNIPVPPPYMVYIPGGHFYMGQWENGNAASSRQVYISPMFMDRNEVWGSLFVDVREWGNTNGYSIVGGSSREGGHPIQSISWYNAVKWCNARSEREGLTPVYYTDTSHTTVYRTGDVALTNAMVKWNANGYRLPTEAEWEKAARGGLTGKEYPWGDTINNQMANYSGSVHPWSGTTPRTTPIGYYNGNQQGGGPDTVNGYGLYDMAGNVWEWCWDRWQSVPEGDHNPKGPDTGSNRLLRGGSWGDTASSLRCANRNNNTPTNTNNNIGFRCARGIERRLLARRMAEHGRPRLSLESTIEAHPPWPVPAFAECREQTQGDSGAGRLRRTPRSRRGGGLHPPCPFYSNANSRIEARR